MGILLDGSRGLLQRDPIDGRPAPNARERRPAPFLGFRDRRAAGVLGIPLGTYKSRLNRATAALRSAVEAGRALQPTWSPDGTRLVFVGVRVIGTPVAAVAAADGSGARLVPGGEARTHPRLRPVP